MNKTKNLNIPYVLKELEQNFGITFTKTDDPVLGKEKWQYKKGNVLVQVSRGYYAKDVNNGAEHLSIWIEDRIDGHYAGCGGCCENEEEAIEDACTNWPQYGLKRKQVVQLQLF